MGMVGSVAMGLPWKGRSRGSICWVGSVSGCWVLLWKGRGRGSVCWVESGKRRRIGPLGLAVERKWQRIGMLGVAVERKRQRIGLLGLAVERERQRISLLVQIGLLGLAVERKRQRIRMLGLTVERELSSHGARRGGAGRKIMAEYSCGRNVMAERQKRRQSGSVLFLRGRKVMAVG